MTLNNTKQATAETFQIKIHSVISVALRSSAIDNCYFFLSLESFWGKHPN